MIIFGSLILKVSSAVCCCLGFQTYTISHRSEFIFQAIQDFSHNSFVSSSTRKPPSSSTGSHTTLASSYFPWVVYGRERFPLHPVDQETKQPWRDPGTDGVWREHHPHWSGPELHLLSVCAGRSCSRDRTRVRACVCAHRSSTFKVDGGRGGWIHFCGHIYQLQHPLMEMDSGTSGSTFELLILVWFYKASPGLKEHATYLSGRYFHAGSPCCWIVWLRRIWVMLQVPSKQKPTSSIHFFFHMHASKPVVEENLICSWLWLLISFVGLCSQLFIFTVVNYTRTFLHGRAWTGT